MRPSIRKAHRKDRTYCNHKTIGSKSGAAEHTAILNAIEAQDGELAALLMKRHIQRSKRDILEYMQNDAKKEK